MKWYTIYKFAISPVCSDLQLSPKESGYIWSKWPSPSWSGFAHIFRSDTSESLPTLPRIRAPGASNCFSSHTIHQTETKKHWNFQWGKAHLTSGFWYSTLYIRKWPQFSCQDWYICMAHGGNFLYRFQKHEMAIAGRKEKITVESMPISCNQQLRFVRQILRLSSFSSMRSVNENEIACLPVLHLH